MFIAFLLALTCVIAPCVSSIFVILRMISLNQCFLVCLVSAFILWISSRSLSSIGSRLPFESLLVSLGYSAGVFVFGFIILVATRPTF